MSSQGLIQIVQGGQWGSEAKGAIAAHLCQNEDIAIAVRTGATNAGHTVIYNGTPVKMQQLPVGWVNPNTELVVGAGALIDFGILQREIKLINDLTGADVRDRLRVDYRAAIHLPDHAQRSKDANRHHLIGATGKGCSEALIDRVRNRGVNPTTMEQIFGTGVDGIRFSDTENHLNIAYNMGARIQLEATQGTLLDLCLGPYPYTTHKQTGPAQWMMEAGLSPALRTDIVMVLRTYPIRVAGNSGPMGMETSWPWLARNINRKLERSDLPPLVKEESIREFETRVVTATNGYEMPRGATGLDQHVWSQEERVQFKEALSEVNTKALQLVSAETLADLSKLFEFTTVTRKLRRIAQMTHYETSAAVRQVRPSRVAMTFMNYLYPEMWGATSAVNFAENTFIEGMRHVLQGARVAYINRGPGPEHIIPVHP